MTLYFVALLPDAGIQAEVTAFKEAARDRFGSGHALKSPPHITLVPPFRVAQTPLFLSEIASRLEPFPVQLRHFDRFGKRVIFVGVENSEALQQCQRETSRAFEAALNLRPDNRPFHPHMTVAFRDLPVQRFPAAWAYFAGISYERTFTASGLTLLRHTGAGWVIAETCSFPTASPGEVSSV